MRRGRRPWGIAAAVIAAAACFAPRPVTSAESVAVREAQIARVHGVAVTNAPPYYSPAELSIRAGETVRWTNQQLSDTHSAIETSRAAFALEIPPGESASYRFERPGEYLFRCRYHPWMGGKVTVRAADLRLSLTTLPPALAGGRLVSAADGRYLWLVGLGDHPAVARIEEGSPGPVAHLEAGAAVRPGSACVGASGELWLLADPPTQLVRVAPDGRIDRLAVPAAIGSPTAIAASRDGPLWLFDGAGRRVVRLSAGGDEVAWSGEVLPGGDDAMRAEVDPEGALWLFAPGWVGRVDPQGGETTVRELPPESGALGVAGGRAWVRTAGGVRLLAVAPDGDLQSYSLPPGGEVVALSATPGGAVWLARADGSLGRLAGDRLETFELTPALTSLDGVLVDASSTLWLTSSAGATIASVPGSRIPGDGF